MLMISNIYDWLNQIMRRGLAGKEAGSNSVETLGMPLCSGRVRIVTWVLILLVAATGSPACTIFVLVERGEALFCNNEDWSNPVTRIWFVPAGTNYFGCAYLGFDDGWAQGGMNSEGLAFDWVAGGTYDYRLDPTRPALRGNPSERMLESCATVEEAIAFYQRHNEASFRMARMLVADKSGASAVISARGGDIYAERAEGSRGFGYGGQRLEVALAKMPAARLADGFKILRSCNQGGEFPTRYSNIFDLKKGMVHILTPGSESPVSLNFQEQIAKGGIYYDLAKLGEQIKEPARALLPNMRRLPLDSAKTIVDHAPQITERIRAILSDAREKPFREADFAPGFWQQIAPEAENIRSQLAALGELQSMTRVERDGGEGHRYRIDFEQASILVTYVLDDQNRLAGITTHAVEQKPK